MIESEQFQDALKYFNSYDNLLEIKNEDRAVGARIAGTIARVHGDLGYAERGGAINLKYKGSAGQSFGAFCIPGLNLHLEGQANDYVGKSMGGGVIAIRPDPEFEGKTNKNVIIGNTCLYGANGGKMFASGTAGERLAVRNSGCHAVVEGAGDHCCEYMTDGRVVVLGSVGRNCGAGMTGGLAFILDQGDDFAQRVSSDVKHYRIHSEATKKELYGLIQEFVFYTNSQVGRKILQEFDYYVSKFWLIVPPSEEQKDDAPKPRLDEKMAQQKTREFQLVGAGSGAKTLERDYFDKVMN